MIDTLADVMREIDEARIAAFNSGCDARLRGEQLGANPFDPSEAEYRPWNRGWIDVHVNWGKHFRTSRPRCWDFAVLPPIKGTVSCAG